VPIDLFSALAWSLSRQCTSDNRDTWIYRSTAPEEGTSPFAADPGRILCDIRAGVRPGATLLTGMGLTAESRITPKRAITNRPAVRHAEEQHERELEGLGRSNPVRAQTYEITFLGQAGTTLRTEFDDCEVTIGPGTTTLRADLPDRGALSGLIERIGSLGLDLIDVSLVAPPPGK
jgi:hypothetical protein